MKKVNLKKKGYRPTCSQQYLILLEFDQFLLKTISWQCIGSSFYQHIKLYKKNDLTMHWRELVARHESRKIDNPQSLVMLKFDMFTIAINVNGVVIVKMLLINLSRDYSNLQYITSEFPQLCILYLTWSNFVKVLLIV